MLTLAVIGTWAAMCIALGALIVRWASRLETRIDDWTDKSDKRFDDWIDKSDKRFDKWIAEAVHDRRVAQSRMEEFHREMRRLEKQGTLPERINRDDAAPWTSPAD